MDDKLLMSMCSGKVYQAALIRQFARKRSFVGHPKTPKTGMPRATRPPEPLCALRWRFRPAATQHSPAKCSHHGWARTCAPFGETRRATVVSACVEAPNRGVGTGSRLAPGEPHLAVLRRLFALFGQLLRAVTSPRHAPFRPRRATSVRTLILSQNRVPVRGRPNSAQVCLRAPQSLIRPLRKFFSSYMAVGPGGILAPQPREQTKFSYVAGLVFSAPAVPRAHAPLRRRGFARCRPVLAEPVSRWSRTPNPRGP